MRKQWAKDEGLMKVDSKMEMLDRQVGRKGRLVLKNRFEDLQQDDEDEIHEINAVTNEVVEVTVDSGASKSVWPMTKTGVRRSKLAKPVRLAAANGTEIEVKGAADLDFLRADRKCSMRFLDANVKRPLASVSAIVDQGNRVAFAPQASYVESLATGERLEMIRRRGVFVLELQTEGRTKGHAKMGRSGRMDVEQVEEAAEETEADDEVEQVEEVGKGMWFRRRLNEGDMQVFRRQA